MKVSREPSQAQSITNAFKTSLIYPRGTYSISQHQSTLVFTRVIVAHVHMPIGKKREKTLSQPAAFSRKRQQRKITRVLLTGPRRRLRENNLLARVSDQMRHWADGRGDACYTIRGWA